MLMPAMSMIVNVSIIAVYDVCCCGVPFKARTSYCDFDVRQVL